MLDRAKVEANPVFVTSHWLTIVPVCLSDWQFLVFLCHFTTHTHSLSIHYHSGILKLAVAVVRRSCCRGFLALRCWLFVGSWLVTYQRPSLTSSTRLPFKAIRTATNCCCLATCVDDGANVVRCFRVDRTSMRKRPSLVADWLVARLVCRLYIFCRIEVPNLYLRWSEWSKQIDRNFAVKFLRIRVIRSCDCLSLWMFMCVRVCVVFYSLFSRFFFIRWEPNIFFRFCFCTPNRSEAIRYSELCNFQK